MANIFQSIPEASPVIPALPLPEPDQQPQEAPVPSSRWRWPELKGQIKAITINKDLKAIMEADPDTYNWVWASVNACIGTREHTTEIVCPEHLAELCPRIYVVKKDTGVIGVMI